MTLEPTGGGSSGPDDLGPAELDEFLERAVERQIVEQQALRETLTALTQAVNALSAPGGGGGGQVDPDDIADAVRAEVRTAIDPLIGEIRSLADDITQAVRSVSDAATAGGAPASGGTPSDELQGLTVAVEDVSTDVEGIAQALIDLNAGLRDWADGVDRNIFAMRETVEQVREIADVGRFSDARDDQAGSDDLDEEEEAEEVPVEIVEARPVVPATVAADPGDLAERIRESIELSLYLADQIEEFDRVLTGMADLPKRLEGIISQGMRRTLAARSKLDSDANATLEQTLSLLDSYVERMSDAVDGFTGSEETLRKLGLGQVELASRLDSLYEAVHELAGGRDSRAASLTKAAPRTERAASKKAKPKAPEPRAKATAKAKAKKPAKRSAKRPARKSSPSTSTD